MPEKRILLSNITHPNVIMRTIRLILSANNHAKREVIISSLIKCVYLGFLINIYLKLSLLDKKARLDIQIQISLGMSQIPIVKITEKKIEALTFLEAT